jgi:hypothetical protein
VRPLRSFLEGCKCKSREAGNSLHNIDAAGTGQTILCSDPGQTSTFGPRGGFRVGIKLCMDLGCGD